MSQRTEFTSQLQSSGVSGDGFSDCTTAIYSGLFGNTYRQLLGSRNANGSWRSKLKPSELARVTAAEKLAVQLLANTSVRGNKRCTRVCRKAAVLVNDVFESMFGG